MDCDAQLPFLGNFSLGCSLSQEQPVLYSGCLVVLQSQQRCTTHYIGWAIYSESHTSGACLNYKCLQGRAPVYLSRVTLCADCLCLESSPAPFRWWQPVSGAQNTDSYIGHRAFSTSGSDAWNTLSSELRHSSVSLDCFKRSLKTFLFRS